MGSVVRMRCPCCGMLVWQSRLNKNYPFEFVRQESKGYGHLEFHHACVAKSDDAQMFQGLLALKMIEKAKRMLAEVDADVEVRIYRVPETRRARRNVRNREVPPAELEVSEHELEVYVDAAFEVAPQIDVDDVGWSFLRWARGRDEQRIAELVAVPGLEFLVDVEMEVDADGEEV